MENGHDHRVITPADLVRAIWHWKWLILILVFVITAAVAMWSLRLPKIYRADAKILLIWMRDDVIRLAGGESVSNIAQHEKDIATEIQILHSHEVAQRVAALESGVSLGAMQALPVKGTNVIQISFEDADPECAARMVGHVIKAYTEFRSHFYKAQDAIPFLREQIDHSRDKVSQLREKLDRLLEKEQIVELDQQKSQLLEQLYSLESQLFELNRKRTLEEGHLQQFRALWKNRKEDDPLPAGSGNTDWSQANELQKQLTALKLRRTVLLEKYTDEYHEVVAVNESMAAVRKMLREQVDQLKQLEEAALLNNLKVLQAEEDVLQTKAAELRSNLKTMPEIEQRYTDLSRDISNYEKIYSTLLQSQEQERLNEARNLNEVSIRIISPPVMPKWPVKPNVKSNIAMAAISSLLLGIGLSFFLDYMNKSVKTPRDIEQLVGLPVLAQFRELPRPLIAGTSEANGKANRTRAKTRVHKKPLLLPPYAMQPSGGDGVAD
jgi:uncharacterized protein involved in exopolysaccharide biosynthesis